MRPPYRPSEVERKPPSGAPSDLHSRRRHRARDLRGSTAECSRRTGVEFEWDWQDAGADVYEEEGTPLPDRVLESISERGLAIKGPITTPVGSGFRSINVALRKELDLYACLRPCKAYEGVRTRFPETDIVIVRENHEDLYAGIEFEIGDEKTDEAAQVHRGDRGHQAPRGRRASRSSRSPSSAPSGSCARRSSTRRPTGARR